MSGFCENNPCFFYRFFFTIIVSEAYNEVWRNGMKLKNLRVNNIEKPIGFQVQPLSFSWTVEDAGNAKKQKSARVRIYEEMSEKSVEVFDSGACVEIDSLDYQVSIGLKPRTRYSWSVEVTADNGERAEAASWFETGKMDESWIGTWISPDASEAEDVPTSSAILRKGFTYGGIGGNSARMYMCGLGVYECYLNGKKVGDEYLAPGYHSYDFHLQAQTYDVSNLLKQGENEIEIWLGEGWFKGRLGFDGGFTDIYGDRLYVIAELYTGGQCIAKTDETWDVLESPIRFNNIYDGEVYDARQKKIPVKGGRILSEAPKNCGELSDRYSLPVKQKETFPVKEVIHTPSGDTVLDFGQNLTGWVEFDCALPPGSEVRLTASEIMQNGEFYHENLRTAKTEFRYISDGEAAHVRPHFTFYGFRYMKLEILGIEEMFSDAELKTQFTAVHLRSDFDQIGWIETGNEKVNQLFSNALWGQKGNFLDVPTDCPQRDERLGWTGDAQVFSETACYNMYMPAFYRKYLWDMRAEQSVLDGAVPNVVPRLKRGMVAEFGSCPWADAGVIIPWNVYLHYGSKTLLAEMYPGMKAWVDHQRKQEEAEGGLHLIKGGFHFADWLALDNEQPGPFGATDPLYIASAYYFRCAGIVADAAEILGFDEADEYKKLAEEIKDAIRQTYFDGDGSCISETQTGAAIAVMFGLSENMAQSEGEQEAESEGDRLNQRVIENNGHLNTGFVGTPLLCPALTKSGHHRTAVDLLLNEDYPGWLYSVNLGATTIWERWDSVMPDGSMNPEGMNSLNHYSYGSIEAWMYGDVAGIRESKPGFKKAVLEPHPDERLRYIDCKLETAVGTYESHWKYEADGSVKYRFVIPFGAEALIRLPDGRTEAVTAGEYTFHPTLSE